MTDIMTLHQSPEWKLYRLGQLFDERKEKGSDKDYPPLSVTMNGIVPQLESAAKTDDGDNRKLVKVGDYVINSRSDRKGSGGISEYDGSVSLISIVLKPKGILPRFAHHLLRSQAFQEEFYRWGHGIVADLWTTRFGDMKNIRILVPPILAQKMIADFLDQELSRIDGLIEKKERLNEVLGIARTSATLKALRGGFSGLDYDSSSNKINFLKLQPNWRRYRIKHLVKHMTSGSRAWSNQIQDEGELFLQSGSISTSMGVSLESSQRISPQWGAEADRARVRPEDILVCITGGRTGAVGFIDEINEPAYVNQHVCLLRARPEIIRPKLLAQMLFSEIGQFQFSLAQYGLKQGLGLSEVANVSIPCPPLSLQKEISDEIAASTQHINVLSDRITFSIARLCEFRTSLINSAVTGRIDIASWCKEGETCRRLDNIQEAMRA